MISVPKQEQRQLPAGWRWVRLGDVCKSVHGSTPSMANGSYWGGDVLWVSPKDMYADVLTQSQDKISKLALRETRIAEVSAGTVLIVIRSGVLAHTLPVAIAGLPLTFNQDIKALVPMRDVLLSDYLRWLLLACESQILAHGIKQGPTVHSIQSGYIENLDLPLPPLPEQQRIVAVLKAQMAAVDKARAAAHVRLEAVKALPVAFLRQVFGDTPVFAAKPVTPTTPVHSGWSWHRLTDIARLATGHTPSRYHPEYWQGTVPWLQLADIRALDGHEAQDTAEHTNELGIANSASVLLPKGTMCMSRTASVGFFAIMGRPMATSQDFVNWVCGEALDPWFLMYLMIANRKVIRDLGSGAVHQTIYFPTVQSFSICVPHITEQRRLAGVLREQMAAAEKARTAAEAEMQTINALPAALLRRAFNGEL